MDNILSMIEPQMAIPVIGVVVFAILVYIFGFQQTQEPSFQHIAVLQSSGKNKNANGVPIKPKNQSVASSPRTTSAKIKEKIVSNGSVVQGTSSSAGKENVKPQQPMTPKGKKEKLPVGNIEVAENAEDGDWIQAVSRKDKKVRVKKEEVKSSADEKRKSSSPPASKPRTILQEIEFRAKLEQGTKNEPEEDLSKDVEKAETAQEVEKIKTTAEKVKPAAKEGGKAKATPKEAEKTAKPPPKMQEIEVVVEKEESKEDAKPAGHVESKLKEAGKTSKSNTESADAKNNVAFDDVGDLWEEAKSRGAKKKRARKD